MECREMPLTKGYVAIVNEEDWSIIEGELATMRLALCEIRKAQHDNEAAAATQRANRERMGSQQENRRAPARVPSNLLRASRRARKDAAKGGR